MLVVTLEKYYLVASLKALIVHDHAQWLANGYYTTIPSTYSNNTVNDELLFLETPIQYCPHLLVRI